MGFSIVNSLGIAAFLSTEEAARIDQQFSTPDEVEQVLRSQPELLKTLLAKFPPAPPISSENTLIYRKITDLSRSLPQLSLPKETIEKVDTLTKQLSNVQDLERGFSDLHAKWKQTPLMHHAHLRDSIKKLMSQAFLSTPEADFLIIRQTTHQLIERYFKQIQAKVTPSLEEILDVLLSHLFAAPPEAAALVGSEPLPCDRIGSLKRGLSASDKQRIDNRVVLQAEVNLKYFISSKEDNSSENLSRISHLIDSFRKLNISDSSKIKLKSEIECLFRKISGTYFDYFDKIHKNLANNDPIETSDIEALNALLKTIETLHELTRHSPFELDLIQKFQHQLSEKILNKYDLKMCQTGEDLLKIYTPSTKAFIECLGEFLILYQNSPMTLERFVETFDKVYLILTRHHKSFKTKQNLDLYFKVFREILIKAIGKSIHLFETTSPGLLIDLSNPHENALSKRLMLHMATFSGLLGTTMQVHIQMKIGSDRLIALLFQLISYRYTVEPSTMLAEIRKWIEEHPDYLFDGFTRWLEAKIAARSPLQISLNPGSLYTQFLKSSLKTGLDSR